MYTDRIEGLAKSKLSAELVMVDQTRFAQIKGFDDALVKHYKTVAYDYIRDHLEDYEFHLYPKLNKYYKEKWIPSKKNSKDRYKYCMITVNPYRNVTLDTFLRCYERAMKKKYIVSSLSCIEWIDDVINTGDTYDNGGMHLHTRIQIANKDPYRIKNEFYNTFKHVTEPQCVEILYSNVDDAFIQYIKGFKKSKKDGLYHPKSCLDVTVNNRSIYGVPPVLEDIPK